MPYLLPIPGRQAFEHWATLSAPIFTPEECDKVIAIGNNQGWDKAITLAGDQPAKRRSEVSWLRWGPDKDWIFTRIGQAAMEINHKYFGFELSSFAEDFQITKYEGASASHYGWHQDIGAGDSSVRKLSFVIQLSEPGNYEGGSLELFMAKMERNREISRGRGDIIFFPAYEPHRVVPVRKGTRHSLVGWISGHPFR